MASAAAWHSRVDCAAASRTDSEWMASAKSVIAQPRNNFRNCSFRNSAKTGSVVCCRLVVANAIIDEVREMAAIHKVILSIYGGYPFRTSRSTANPALLSHRHRVDILPTGDVPGPRRRNLDLCAKPPRGKQKQTGKGLHGNYHCVASWLRLSECKSSRVNGFAKFLTQIHKVSAGDAAALDPIGRCRRRHAEQIGGRPGTTQRVNYFLSGRQHTTI